MKLKTALRTLGTVAAALAVLLGLISLNVNANGVSDVNPFGAVAVGVGALALLKASELAD